LGCAADSVFNSKQTLTCVAPRCQPTLGARNNADFTRFLMSERDMDSAVLYTKQPDSAAAGRELGARIIEALPGDPANAVIVFASPHYAHEELLVELTASCRPGLLVGASSAGEFTREVHGEGMACALALRAHDMQFSAGLGEQLDHDPGNAARQIVSGFCGLSDSRFAHRSALVMTDALAGHADELVEQLTIATAGQYQFFGGGAGDNAQFQRTHVFFETRAVTNAAVALEILSEKPIGVGVSHGWEPASVGFRVTEAAGMQLIGLNGFPAVEAFEEHAERTGQRLDRAAPIPFFLHNILGIETGAGYRLRVPLAVDSSGSVVCASEIPEGAIVRIMRSSEQSAITAAERATASALSALHGSRPKVALFFDCVATRLRLGEVFGLELDALTDHLGHIDLAGCNTHGQIARAEGQFGGFHNCTAVVCVFPE
jgi:hypothetical protein